MLYFIILQQYAQEVMEYPLILCSYHGLQVP